jgi:tetratricopeptide (TPR) repeat protein
MKSALQEKYSIAWFKLAECISRREKERALGVYRLLSHSFENQALGCQLEADILLACNDSSNAIKMYERAAQFYYEQHEPVQAAAIYDHLFTISGDQGYLETIVALYAQLKQPHRVLVYVHHVCMLMLRRKEFDQVFLLLDRLQMLADEKNAFITELACRGVADAQVSGGIKNKILIAALDLVMHDVRLLGLFFSKIKAIDAYYYQEACAYVESKKDTF